MRAVVDIGSNSIKFLIAQDERNALEILEKGSWVTRLGKNMDRNGGYLEKKSLDDTAEALKNMRQVFKNYKRLKDIRVVATAAARNAKNSAELSKLVEEILKRPLRILSGQEEARYSLMGAQQAAQEFFPSSRFVFMDIGGASTEIGFLAPKFLAHSFQAGAVKCHEGLGLDQMPVKDARWQQAHFDVAQFFPEKNFKELFSSYEASKYRAIAVGGTLMLAAQFCENLLQTDKGILITRHELEKFANFLRKLSLSERKKLPGMDPERADILPAGLLVLNYCLTRLGQDEVFVTVWGLRHGMLV